VIFYVFLVLVFAKMKANAEVSHFQNKEKIYYGAFEFLHSFSHLHEDRKVSIVK